MMLKNSFVSHRIYRPSKVRHHGLFSHFQRINNYDYEDGFYLFYKEKRRGGCVWKF